MIADFNLNRVIYRYPRSFFDAESNGRPGTTVLRKVDVGGGAKNLDFSLSSGSERKTAKTPRSDIPCRLSCSFLLLSKTIIIIIIIHDRMIVVMMMMIIIIIHFFSFWVPMN